MTRLIQRAAVDKPSGDALVNAVYIEIKALAHKRLRRDGAGRAAGVGGKDVAAAVQVTQLAHDAIFEVMGFLGTIRDSQHFFAAIAQAMNRLVVDHARHQLAAKRGGKHPRVSLEHDADLEALQVNVDPSEILLFDEFVKLWDSLDERKTTIARLRHFGVLSTHDIANALGVSERTVEREYRDICRQLSAWLAVHASFSEREGGTSGGDSRRPGQVGPPKK